METAQMVVLFFTFLLALTSTIIAIRIDRRVSKVFGKGLNFKEAIWQFFSDVPDAEGNAIPPQAAFYGFVSGIARDCTDHAIEQLPGALVSLKGKSFAQKAADTSAFARGAQNLSAGGFGELNDLKDMVLGEGGIMSKIGTGGKKGDMISQLMPMFLER